MIMKRLFLLWILPFSVLAHDTNVTHPVITETAVELIKKADSVRGAYAELYAPLNDDENNNKQVDIDKPEFKRNIYRYWGFNPRLRKYRSKKRDEDAKYTCFQAKLKGVKTPGIARCLSYYKRYSDLTLKHYGLGRTVMEGIVMEDDPHARVVSHFYHAYSGSEMDMGSTHANAGIDLYFGRREPSKDAAQRFYNKSIELMGYELEDPIEDIPTFALRDDYSKPLSFWLFGHALHHVEDMNSIAHTQNDPHITKGGTILGQRVHHELDDYEGVYIRYKLQEKDAYGEMDKLDDEVDPKKDWFEIKEKFPQPVTSFNHIWSLPSGSLTTLAPDTLEATSLSRTTYNYSVFQGKLPYPTQIFSSHLLLFMEDQLNGAAIDNEAIANGRKGVCGMDEYKDYEFTQMFWTGTDCDIKYDSRWGLSKSRWEIKNIGFYDYQGFDIAAYTQDRDNTSWWPTDDNGGPEGYFYIEQKMRGDERKDVNKVNFVEPPKLRQDISKPYHSLSNPVVPNTRSLLSVFAEKLMPIGVAYTAGFSQMWYRAANTPPYLKEVRVVQNLDLHGLPSDQSEYTNLYDARWESERAVGELTMQFETGPYVTLSDTKMPFWYAKQRKLTMANDYSTPEESDKKKTKMFNPKKELILCLTFNESIKKPWLPESGFKLGMQLLNPFNGAAEADVFIPMQEDYFFEQKSVEGFLEHEEENIQAVEDNPETCKVLLPHFNTQQETWKITIPDDVIYDQLKAAGQKNIHGPVRLIVEAEDKNIHGALNTGNTPGTKLDDDPSTPARKYIDSGPQWHTKESAPGDMFPESGPGDFAYEYSTGDRSHLLLLSYVEESEESTEPPAAGEIKDVIRFTLDHKLPAQ